MTSLVGDVYAGRRMLMFERHPHLRRSLMIRPWISVS